MYARSCTRASSSSSAGRDSSWTRSPSSPLASLLITVTFRARVAADNHHQVYEFSVGRVSGPGCANGGGGVSSTSMIPIHDGSVPVGLFHFTLR